MKRGGETVEVEPQVFSLLACLIENRERVVSKDELIEMVWDGRIVSDGTLNTRINSVRRAVGDDGKRQAVIKTFPRRGFRFVAELEGDGVAEDTSRSSAASILSKPSIVVLPFANLPGDPEQAYFSDGITEDIITALSRIRQFFVIARNTSFAYKGKAVDAQTIANDLGIRYLLEGSVRKSGNRVRISVQLIDGDTGNHLWAEQYDRDLEDIFEVQDEITQTVVGAIEPEMAKAERNRAILNRPDNLGAWELYQRGTAHLWDQGGQGQPRELEKALDYFDQCIGLDPRFARAYTGKAYVKFISLILGLTDQRAQVLEEGFAAAKKAIELDPQDAWAHAHLSGLYYVNRQPDEAIRLSETAIKLNPNSPHGYHFLGISQISCGKASEGLHNLELSAQISPQDPYTGPTLAWIAIGNLGLGNFQETVQWAQKALDNPHTQFWTNAALVSAYGNLESKPEAIRARDNLIRRKPDFTIAFANNFFPVRHPEYLTNFIDGLRKAGVPEE